ncbi:hypothetical protein SESBI_46550 [Sesbania bispinosa]|nr:hypothetical protein SESBI_46550 [Sesbania bispinosa]
MDSTRPGMRGLISFSLYVTGEFGWDESWAASDIGDDDPGKSSLRATLVFTFLVLLWQGSSIGLNLKELMRS